MNIVENAETCVVSCLRLCSIKLAVGCRSFEKRTCGGPQRASALHRPPVQHRTRRHRQHSQDQSSAELRRLRKASTVQTTRAFTPELFRGLRTLFRKQRERSSVGPPSPLYGGV